MEFDRKVIYQPVLQTEEPKSTSIYTEKSEEPLNIRKGAEGCCADCIEGLYCCNLLASCNKTIIFTDYCFIFL